MAFAQSILYSPRGASGVFDSLVSSPSSFGDTFQFFFGRTTSTPLGVHVLGSPSFPSHGAGWSHDLALTCQSIPSI